MWKLFSAWRKKYRLFHFSWNLPNFYFFEEESSSLNLTFSRKGQTYLNFTFRGRVGPSNSHFFSKGHTYQISFFRDVIPLLKKWELEGHDLLFSFFFVRSWPLNFFFFCKVMTSLISLFSARVIPSYFHFWIGWSPHHIYRWLENYTLCGHNM